MTAVCANQCAHNQWRCSWLGQMGVSLLRRSGGMLSIYTVYEINQSIGHIGLLTWCCHWMKGQGIKVVQLRLLGPWVSHSCQNISYMSTRGSPHRQADIAIPRAMPPAWLKTETEFNLSETAWGQVLKTDEPEMELSFLLSLRGLLINKVRHPVMSN